MDCWSIFWTTKTPWCADSVRHIDAGLPTAFGRGYTTRQLKETQGSAQEADEDIKANGSEGSAGMEGKRIFEAQDQSTDNADEPVDTEVYAGLSAKEKKLFDLRLKLNAARKANQMAIVAEKKREDAPEESRGISKKKWFEEKQKKLGKQLESNGLDMSKAYMLDTQEDAEYKYKKWDKKPAPFGWDVFNQRSLYNAYKKRTKNVEVTMEEYIEAQKADPDFYRDGTSLQYGKAPELPEANIDRMVNELVDRGHKRKEFSRRRKFHEERDVDSINDRNEHFNRKIERAFGKYTVEIKNNLERGTALPD